MSIKPALLALLTEGPSHGYQLKTSFEARTGSAWPLNIGQVYSTLARAERDGLVSSVDADEDGRVVYVLTPAGRREVTDWFAQPVRHETAPRDELAIKLAVAVTAPGVDVRAIVQTQRAETMRALQELTRLKVDADEHDDLAWLLVVDHLIFEREAQARWLDHCESRLARATAAPRRRGPANRVEASVDEHQASAARR